MQTPVSPIPLIAALNLLAWSALQGGWLSERLLFPSLVLLALLAGWYSHGTLVDTCGIMLAQVLVAGTERHGYIGVVALSGLTNPGFWGYLLVELAPVIAAVWLVVTIGRRARLSLDPSILNVCPIFVC